MSNGTDRPQRAWLSLRSMGVMCVVLAVFAWANAKDRRRDLQLLHVAEQPPRKYSIFALTGDRGFPWACGTAMRKVAWADESGYHTPSLDAESHPVVEVKSGPLLLNLAFALTVSVALALASERFVFGRLRSGPRPEAKENPK